MISSVTVLALVYSIATTTANAQTTATAPDPRLVGTWSSKSGMVMTGPDFYNPVNEMLKEPNLPGSSFSFTADGFFEEALYIVVSNPTRPNCPVAMLQWQHGQYVLQPNGTLVLTPIKIDGRQLYSDPCNHSKSIYSRYNQTEVYKWYEVLMDERRGKKRLNLFKHGGAPMNPMYLEYNPPQMLPTTTLKPLPTATAGGGGENKNKRTKKKRSLSEGDDSEEEARSDSVFWVGIGLIGLGIGTCLWV